MTSPNGRLVACACVLALTTLAVASPLPPPARDAPGRPAPSGLQQRMLEAVDAGVAIGAGSLAPARASDVDWAAVRADIERLCREHKHADGSIAPALLRLAWHGAATFDVKEAPHGGTQGATMRFEPEASYGENRGLTEARQALAPIVAAHAGASTADVWVLAAYVAVEHMGGPRIELAPGRSDATEGGAGVCPPEKRLPGFDDAAGALRSKFGRLGLDDRGLVALAGAHTVGHTHEEASGFPHHKWDSTPLVFDNRYYDFLLNDWWIYDDQDPERPYYRNRSWIMLLSDWVMREDSGMRAHVEEFAADEAAWHAEFARAFKHITDLGLSKPPQPPQPLQPLPRARVSGSSQGVEQL